MAEQEPTCKTPVAWRLTQDIKREFVLCLRPLALTAIFNKVRDSVGRADLVGYGIRHASSIDFEKAFIVGTRLDFASHDGADCAVLTRARRGEPGLGQADKRPIGPPP